MRNLIPTDLRSYTKFYVLFTLLLKSFTIYFVFQLYKCTENIRYFVFQVVAQEPVGGADLGRQVVPPFGARFLGSQKGSNPYRQLRIPDKIVIFHLINHYLKSAILVSIIVTLKSITF